MHIISTCPDGPTLQRFLLGQDTPEEAAALEQHLEQCGPCLSTLQGLHGEDSVVEAIRSQGGTVVDAAGETVRRLADRLKRLEPIEGGTAPTEFPGPDEPTLPPAHPSAPSAMGSQADALAPGTSRAASAASYDFLAPAQGPGELGRLGHYQVRKVLGSGGMGVVFQAYDPHLERLVALKAMLPALAASPGARQRFLREAKAAAAIKHDHVVTIYQVGEEGGAPFLAMEFLEGEALEQRLQRQGKLPLQEVLQIGRETAEALAAAHGNGLIHRDIKPANIWLDAAAGGRVEILDFGLARATGGDQNLTQSGAIVGTPSYMAPEQAQGKKVDAQADLFSLGVVLYRLSTGQLPFGGTDVLSTLLALATQEPAPPRTLNPDLPPALADLMMKLLAKKPAQRPPSARAVAEALRAIEHSLASPPARRPSSRRRRFLVAAALLLALGGLGSILYGPTLVRYVSNEGELIIEIDDPKIQAVVDQAGVTIRDRARDREYKVKPGRVPLKSGEYVLEVTEVGGDMALVTREFTIRRGGRTTLRVTLDPKRLVIKAKMVSWAGGGPEHVFADEAHSLREVLDFRDLAGADAKQLRDWVAALGPEYHLSMITSRRGIGPTLFNAVAVREKKPNTFRFLPEVTEKEAKKIRKGLDKEGFQPFAMCMYFLPDQKVDCTEAQVWVKKEGNYFEWYDGSLAAFIKTVAEEKDDGYRPIYLDVLPIPEDPNYLSLGVEDQDRRWEGKYTLTGEELVSAIAASQRKGWRPDVLAPYWDGGRLRFMLVVVDNFDQVAWRFRMDMSLAEYQKESAQQKRQGLFPLALTSYGNKADVLYAAVWVRFRGKAD